MSETSGPSVKVTVFGDNTEEIESAALDQARKFFGAEGRPEVVRDYVAESTSGWLSPPGAFKATVLVREPDADE